MQEDEKRAYVKSQYTFDRVYSAEDNNELLYKESIEKEMENAMNGYNTSIMLYGVTGSGKTHTVFGNLGYRDMNSSSSENGVIYYCFEYLMKLQGIECAMTYVEIYNEQVKDLLGTDDNLPVNENAKGEVVVQGVSQEPISSFEHMIELVRAGNQRRKMAKTNANAFSSRSHAILQLYVKSKQGRTVLSSKISFIDLAGSERVDLTQNKGKLIVTKGSGWPRVAT